nr:tRNA pseudouridine(55) synthase TruB [Sphingomonas melonis]
MHGWIIVDKPLGLGSTHVVSAVKRALRQGGYGKFKVGHGGTLDPLATGVLPVAVGEATKLAGRMLDSDKVYDFTIRFGEQTDTLDAEGVGVATSDVRPTLADVEAVLPRFTGPISQVPPAYSALKVDGERAYDLARAGEEVVLASRDVTVHALHSSPARGRWQRDALTEGRIRRTSHLRTRPLHHSPAASGPPPPLTRGRNWTRSSSPPTSPKAPISAPSPATSHSRSGQSGTSPCFAVPRPAPSPSHPR